MNKNEMVLRMDGKEYEVCPHALTDTCCEVCTEDYRHECRSIRPKQREEKI